MLKEILIDLIYDSHPNAGLVRKEISRQLQLREDDLYCYEAAEHTLQETLSVLEVALAVANVAYWARQELFSETNIPVDLYNVMPHGVQEMDEIILGNRLGNVGPCSYIALHEEWEDEDNDEEDDMDGFTDEEEEDGEDFPAPQ